MGADDKDKDTNADSKSDDIESSVGGPVFFTTDLTSMNRHQDGDLTDTPPKAPEEPRKDVGISAQYSNTQSESKAQAESKAQEKSASPSTSSSTDDSQTLGALLQENGKTIGIVFAVGVVLVIGAKMLFGGSLSKEDVYKHAVKSTVLITTNYKIKNVKIGGSLGSGFFVAPHVVCTNAHVAFFQIPIKKLKLKVNLKYDACNVKLLKKEGTFVARELLGYDIKDDIALLYVSGIDAPPLKMRDQKDLVIGEEVHALGSPGGLEGVFNSGTISYDGLREGLFIEHTASVGPGMSGGPLLDNSGNVIGVNTLYLGKKLEHANLNFSVPIRTVEELLKSEKVQKKLKEVKEKIKKGDGGFNSH